MKLKNEKYLVVLPLLLSIHVSLGLCLTAHAQVMEDHFESANSYPQDPINFYRRLFPSLGKTQWEMLDRSAKELGILPEDVLELLTLLRKEEYQSAKNLLKSRGKIFGPALLNGKGDELKKQEIFLRDFGPSWHFVFGREALSELHDESLVLNCLTQTLDHGKWSRTRQEQASAGCLPSKAEKWTLVQLPQIHWHEAIENFSADEKEKYVGLIFHSQLEILKYLRVNPDAVVFEESIPYEFMVNGIEKYLPTAMTDFSNLFPQGNLPEQEGDFSPEQKMFLARYGAPLVLFMNQEIKGLYGAHFGKRITKVQEQVFEDYNEELVGGRWHPYLRHLIFNIRELAIKKSIEKHIKQRMRSHQVPGKIVLIYGGDHNFRKYFANHEFIEWENLPCPAERKTVSYADRPFGKEDLLKAKKGLKKRID